MMNFDVDERKAQLKHLQDFITSISSQVSFIGEELGWTTECTNESELELVECPVSGEHRVPKEKLNVHVEQCRWRREGYDQDDVPLPARPSNAETHGKCIQIGKEEQMAVFREALLHNPSLNIKFVGQCDERPAPQTSNRWVADFTVDERRVLYDYAVSKTSRQATVKLEDLTMSFQKEEKPRPKTMLEQLAEERDAKRRRISHRGKKVHTNRKSQTEILREVILNQMELLEEWQKQVLDTNVVENGDEHDEGSCGSKEPQCLGDESNAGGQDCCEELGSETSESLRRAAASYCKEDSPWRMLEREGRNPYIRENWEKICEKHARRNHSFETLHSGDSYNRRKSDRYDSHGKARFEKYENKKKMNRYSDDRRYRRHDEFHTEAKRNRKSYQAAYSHEQDGESTKVNSKYQYSSDSRQDSCGSKHHKRYYDCGDSDGSERSCTKSHRGRSDKQHRSSKSEKKCSVPVEAQHVGGEESNPRKHRRDGDVYDSRSRGHRKESAEYRRDHNRRSNSADSSKKLGKSHRDSRSRSPNNLKKKKKKKKHKRQSCSPSSDN